MQIHFSRDLKLNDSKKEIISDLVCQRINLLIGTRKALCVENVFFCDTLPTDVVFLQPSAINHNLSQHIGLYLSCGKVNLFCTSKMLYSLIHQTVETPNFDDAMMTISREFPISFSS